MTITKGKGDRECLGKVGGPSENMTCDLMEEKALTRGRFGGTASMQWEQQM